MICFRFFCLTRELELIVEFHHNQVLHEDLLVVEIECEINQQEHGLLYHHQHLWKNFPIKYGLTIQEKKKFKDEKSWKFTSRCRITSDRPSPPSFTKIFIRPTASCTITGSSSINKLSNSGIT